MTLSAAGTIAAVVLFIAGTLYFSRKPEPRTRLVGAAASLIVAGIIGWLAWYIGVSPVGG